MSTNTELGNPENQPNNTQKEFKIKLEERHIAALAYLFFAIPLVFTPKTKFTIYHANQSLWLLILSFVAFNFFSLLSLFSFCTLPILLLIIIIFVLFGVVNALNNKMIPLPGFERLPTILKD